VIGDVEDCEPCTSFVFLAAETELQRFHHEQIEC
jgi:hypothetical protein